MGVGRRKGKEKEDEKSVLIRIINVAHRVETRLDYPATYYDLEEPSLRVSLVAASKLPPN